MGETIPLIGRAARSRRQGFAFPVIRTQAEARIVAEELAAALRELRGRERLLLSADLHDLLATLDRRIERLEADMAADREQLMALARSLDACRSYAAPRKPRPGR